MLNPNKKIIQGDGVDIPIMYVYLAGRICGEHIDKCLAWRHQIVDYYKNYKGKGVYPISFLDALNSKESDSIDQKGLTSAIPPKLIFTKDILSVQKADVVVANMNDYMEEGINFWTHNVYTDLNRFSKEALEKRILRLEDKILNRRPNWGTDFEVSIAIYLGKPTILIAGNKRRKEMLEKHPFMREASYIASSVEDLLEKQYLNILYKSISSAIY
jgi:nucleoside 2-deoxyribosyltransferase